MYYQNLKGGVLSLTGPRKVLSNISQALLNTGSSSPGSCQEAPIRLTLPNAYISTGTGHFYINSLTLSSQCSLTPQKGYKMQIIC